MEANRLVTPAGATSPARWLHYAPMVETHDEMRQADGQIRPHWQQLMGMFGALGLGGMAHLQQDVRRLLRDNGVTYNVHGAPDGLQRPWPLDMIPLIIAEDDWTTIEAGVTQRAELLNLVLKDLYGESKLIAKGLIPPELVYGHIGFLRPCDRVFLDYSRQLIIYAADLARGPDGRMWVLSDRTQAPSGAGYALENRTVMASVMRSMFGGGQIRYLSNFFRELQMALIDLTPKARENPRIVVMTPGSHNETYFEHAYLAAYLGYSLVQGNDLTVVDGTVTLKSLAGLQPVDVILRRVDDNFCDPLELREDSFLGVAGLLEAARRQKVAVANPLGSSVLENAGLIPFLPGLAKHFFNEALILPTAATWWCGQPREMNYVLENLTRLVIKPIARQSRSSTLFGDRLSKKELTALRSRIQAQPHLYVGQERVSFSTSPCFVDGQLEARHTVLRSFAVARPSGYVVMPGGLTRSASTSENFLVSNSFGGISKDTWVLASDPQQHVSLWLTSNRSELSHANENFLPSRAAENLFWVGRYTERAENTVRLLRVIFEYLGGETLLADEIEKASLHQLLRALTHVTMTYPGFVDKGAEAQLREPTWDLLSFCLDPNRVGALAADLRAMINAAYAVRDFWGNDTWRMMNDIDESWSALRSGRGPGLDAVQRELNNLLTRLMALAGLHSESMIHTARWQLLDMGRRLERALRTAAFLRATLVIQQPQLTQQLLLESVLKATENVITYRRRYRSHLHLQPVLDLLLLDDKNPRALIYQINQLQAHVGKLPHFVDDYRMSAEEQLLLQAYTRLRLADTTQLAKALPDSGLCQALDDLMRDLSGLLSELSNELTQRYFTHAQPPRQFTAIQPDLLPQLLVSAVEGLSVVEQP